MYDISKGRAGETKGLEGVTPLLPPQDPPEVEFHGAGLDLLVGLAYVVHEHLLMPSPLQEDVEQVTQGVRDRLRTVVEAKAAVGVFHGRIGYNPDLGGDAVEVDHPEVGDIVHRPLPGALLLLTNLPQGARLDRLPHLLPFLNLACLDPVVPLPQGQLVEGDFQVTI